MKHRVSSYLFGLISAPQANLLHCVAAPLRRVCVTAVLGSAGPGSSARSCQQPRTLGIELHCASPWNITIIAVWIGSPVWGIPSECRRDDNSTRTCVSRKRRHHHRSRYAYHQCLFHSHLPRQLDVQFHLMIVKNGKSDG